MQSDEQPSSEDDEVGTLEAMLRRPAGDPLHRWARRRMIKLGLLADEPDRPRGPVRRPTSEDDDQDRLR